MPLTVDIFSTPKGARNTKAKHSDPLPPWLGMAQAQPHHARKAQHKTMAGASTSNTAHGSLSTSISKLKAALRSAKRLLARDKLDAGLRVETERKVQALGSELAEAEKCRPAAAIDKAVGEGTSLQAERATQKRQDKSKKRTTPHGSGKNEKRHGVYKMLRHVEYQKTARQLKAATKELANVMEQLQAYELESKNPTKADASKRKGVEREIEEKKEEVTRAKTDAWYVAVSGPPFLLSLPPSSLLIGFTRRPFLPTKNTCPSFPLALSYSIQTHFPRFQ